MDSGDKGDFLSRDDILNIFAKFAKQNKKEDDKKGAKKKKGAEEEEDGHFKERFPGEVVWIKNTDYNENVQDNSECPFYKVQIIENVSEDKISCKLYEGKEFTSHFKVEEKKFNGRFDYHKKNVMDNSNMAEDGIQDMINIDELNHATVLYNLY